jgi:hypothetical protein
MSTHVNEPHNWGNCARCARVAPRFLPGRKVVFRRLLHVREVIIDTRFTSKTLVLPLAACVMHTLSKPLHSFLKMHLTSYTIYDTAWCVRLGIPIPDRRTTPNAPTPPAGSPRHRPSRPVYVSSIAVDIITITHTCSSASAPPHSGFNL